MYVCIYVIAFECNRVKNRKATDGLMELHSTQCSSLQDKLKEKLSLTWLIALIKFLHPSVYL